MKKQFLKLKERKMTLFLTIAFVLITSISLGVAILTGNLSISGSTKIKENSWIIYFDNVRKSTDSVESDYDATIVDYGKTKIEFNAHLEKPGDFYEFTVYTVNDGTIDAMVKSIEKVALTEEQQKYLDFEVTYDNGDPIRECDELNAGTRRRIKAVVKYKEGLDLNDYTKEDLDLDLYFIINYVQKDNECPPRPIEEQNLLTIKPNGGVYENRTDEKRVYLDEGETYTLGTPTRPMYNFTGWEVTSPEEDGTYTFENATFTMGTEDVVIEATWEEGNYVARIMNTYFPTIKEALDAAEDENWFDNTVHLLKNTTEYTVNTQDDEVVLNLNGYTVKGTFTNEVGTNLTITNGRIEAEDDHTEAVINKGKLSLGIDDKEVFVENSIALVGNDVGLKNEKGSEFYFYDGYIEGVSGLVGGYTGKAEGYYVFVDHRTADNYQRVYLVNNPNRAVAKTTTGGDMFYYNLQDSIKTVEMNKKMFPELTDNDYVIYATRNFEAAYEIEVATNTRIFFDLVGFNVQTGEKITNNGYFKISNSDDSSSTLKTSVSIINKNELEIDNLTITQTTDDTAIINESKLKLTDSLVQGKNGYGVSNTGNGTIELDEETTITSTNNYGLYNSSQNFCLTNGTVYGIYNSGSMIIDEESKVTYGTLSDEFNNNNGDARYFYGAIYNTGTVTMDGGEITSTASRKMIQNKGTFNYNGGYIFSEHTAVYNEGTFNANSSKIESTRTAIKNYYGTVNLNGSEVRSATSNTITGDYGTIIMNDGLIWSEVGVAINDSSVTVNGGNVYGNNKAIVANNFKMTDGAVSGENVGVDSKSASISGGMIAARESGVITNTLNMTGGTVVSENMTAITVNSSGTIIDGTIYGEMYGVLSKGTLTLGTNDGNINGNIPTIVGGSYGVYITGSVTDFYDGILKGQVDGYYGKITGTPSGSILAEGTETITNELEDGTQEDIIYLTDFIGEYENWLKVGEEEFNTIDKAMAAIEDGKEGTITVIKDANLTFVQTFVDENKNKSVTFDLNGHHIKTTQAIYNLTDLTIIDSSENQTGTLEPLRVTGIVNQAVLTLNAGNYIGSVTQIIENQKTATINNAKFNVAQNAIRNTGTLTIENINIERANNGIQNTGSIVMRNGAITVSNVGIYESTGTFTMYGGSITAGNVGTENQNVTLNDGTIFGTNYGIGGNNGGKTINGGRVSSYTNNAVFSYYSGITINGGTITSRDATAVLGHHPITINGGTITGTRGIKNEIWCNGSVCYWYDITVNDGYIEGTVNEGIYVTGGNLYFYGGTSKGKTYGVINYASTHIGKNEYPISTSNPVLIGEQYGYVTTEEYFTDFFDGILKGKTAAHTGLINRIPDGSIIKDDFEYINREEYKTQYIVEKGNWLKVGDKEFNSINDASSAIQYEGTITVIADAYVDFDQTLPNGKEIIFDLNGHTLTMTRPLVTAGAITITDSKGTGYINNIEENAINNTGTLTLAGGTIFSEEHYAVNNSGRFNVTGGSISSYQGIANYGTLVISGGTVEGLVGDTLYNQGSTTITGGLVTSKVTNAVNVPHGTVTVNGGQVESTVTDAIRVAHGYQMLGHLVVTGGEITGKTNGIVNTSSSNTIKISGGKIEGITQTGVNTTCNTTITGGEITGATYGVYTTNYLTLGSDDGTVHIDSPILKGELYGLYIGGGTVNFNDGVLKGITDAYAGTITNIPKRTEIFEDTETIDSKLYHADYLLTESEIAVNINTEERYSNLQDALDECGEGETIQLIANVPLYYAVTNNNTAAITLDLNGYTISTNKPITNKGNLTLINTSENIGEIKTSSALTLLTNTNILKTNNVKFKNVSSSYYVVYNQNQLEMENTIVESIYGISNASVAMIKNCQFSSSATAINNSNTLTIEDGTYTGSSYSIYTNSASNVNVTNVTLNGTYYNASNSIVETSNINGSIQNNSRTLNINNSVVNGGNGGSISNTATMNVTNSEVKVTSPTNYYNNNYYTGISNSGTLTFDKSKVWIDNENSYRYYITGIYNSGTLNLNNESELEVGVPTKSQGTYRGIETGGSGKTYIDNSTIHVEGAETIYGMITTSENAEATIKTGRLDAVNSKTSYAAYVDRGTFNQGIYEGTGVESTDTSSENPVLYAQGTSRGIGVKKVNGFFNFYDGIIWASRYAKPETTTRVEYNYEVTTYVDEITGFEYALLEYMKNDYSGSTVAILNDVYYTSVQDAINKAESGDEIVLLKSISEDLVTLPSQNIKLNLNSHSITTTLENNGTINVYNGSLQNFELTTVINNGTFIMGEDDGKVSSTNMRIISEGTTVENNGTFIMNDGYIEGTIPITTDINKIASFARIYTETDSQTTRKYLQSLSEEAIKNGETDLIITIDPASGVYEASKEIRNVYLKYQETYTLSTPTKNGCNFIGWEVSDIDAFNEETSTITMYLNDITVKAKWEISENAVAKIGEEYYTSIAEALNAAKEGDKIEILKNITEDVTNTKDVTIDLGGYTITGEFINEGILKVLNGTIENPNGIGLVNKKSLNIGENDGDVSDTYVKIIGTTIGLQQDGKFNFYDGYIEGDVALYGKTDSLPKGYYLYTEKNQTKNCQRVYLIGNPANAVAVIVDGATTQYFFSLQDAIDTSVVTGSEIFIARDFEASYPVEVKEGTNILINMSSYNITTGNTITNNGTLRIYDTSEDVGSITSAKAITNNGTLTIDKVNVTQNTSANAITNNNNATLNINNATISAQAGNAIYNLGTLNLNGDYALNSTAYALYNKNPDLKITGGSIKGINAASNIELNDVTINSSTNGITNSVSGITITMNNVNISGTNGLYCNATNGTYVLNSGTVKGSTYGVHINQSGCHYHQVDGSLTGGTHGIYQYGSFNSTVTIDNGTVTGTNNTGIYSYNTNSTYRQTVNITGGKVTGKEYGIDANYITNVTISNAEVTNQVSNIDRSAINLGYRSTVTMNEGALINAPSSTGVRFNSNDCSLTMNAGEIKSGLSNGYGVYANGGTININGGKIITTGTSSYGIYNIYSGFTLNMNGGEINSSNIGIYLDRYSNTNYYYEARTININNGTIIGKTYGIYQRHENSTINIGRTTDELSTEIPLISGGLYGIYKTTGYTNFYNGRLRGYTKGYSNSFNALRQKMDIYEYSEEIEENKSIKTYSTTNTSNDAISNYAKEGNGHARITYVGETNEICTNGTTYEFDYTGGEQVFTVPCTGTYTLETWGAQGGGNFGGKGGYSKGEINLSINEVIYINVGGTGELNTGVTQGLGGYNGGGAGGNGSNGYAGGTGGGGATHIATTSGILSSLENNKESVLIVAGGGGGSVANGWNSYYGGSGGGYIGGNGQVYTSGSSTGGTQTAGYKFGQGEDGRSGTGQSYASEGNGGSGGGYYGGITVRSSSQYTNSSGAGGSGYIANPRIYNGVMYGYNVQTTKNYWVNNYLVEKEAFLQVGDETFNSLNDAITAIETEGIITVIKSSDVNETSTVPAEKNITLDLNGHTLTMTQAITNKGEFKLVDSSIDKSGLLNNIKTTALVNQGNMTLDGVSVNATGHGITGNSGTGTITIKNDAKLTASSYGLNITSGQTINVESGLVQCSTYGIYLYGSFNGIINMSGGEVIGTNNTGIYSYNSNNNYRQTVNINGGKVTGKEYGIDANYMTNVTISNAEVTNQVSNIDRSAINLGYRSTVTMNEGALINAPSSTGIRFNSSDCSLTMNAGEIKSGLSNGYGVYANGGTININGGKIITTGTSSYGIYNIYSGFTLNMNGGEINSSNIGIYLDRYSNTNYYYEARTININNGTIIGKTYGIYQRHENSTINIGRTTDELSTEIPLISGGLYGIYKTTGYTNFYNGRLRGTQFGYTNDFHAVRNDMHIHTEIDIPEGVTEYTIPTTTSSTEAKSNVAKAGHGFARIKYIGTTNEICTYGTIYNFDYTGGEQIFEAPCAGTYTLETWGAQGGQALCNNELCGTPGYGGYSYGEIELTESEILYINVGGQGGNATLEGCATGGYNGGGTGTTDGGSCGSPHDNDAAGGGGGATHIATSSGILSSLEEDKESILIVSGGGGGSSWTHAPGHGGGYIGGTASTSTNYPTTSTGYAFGQGQNGSGQKQNTTSTTSETGVAGGGGGYYGGYSNDVLDKSSGTGGSGYIYNERLLNAVMYGYKMYTDGVTISNYLVDKEGFLQVGDQIYNNLNSAIAAIETEGTIIVIRNENVHQSATIPAEKNITLDLNGHTLTMTQAITNKGEFKLVDSSIDKSGLLKNTKTTALVNQGNMTLDGVTVNATGHGITGNSGTGTITIKNDAKLTASSYGLNITSGQTINIESGLVQGSTYGIYLYGSFNGIINMSGGEVIGTSNTGIYSYNTNNNYRQTVNINGGKVTGKEYGIDANYMTNVTISNAEVTNQVSNIDRSAINLGYRSTVTMNEGALINAPSSTGIRFNSSDCSLTMNAGEIKSGLSNGYGVYANGGTININGGKIITTGTSSYGIYNIYSGFTLNMNGGEINSSNIGIYLDRYSNTNYYYEARTININNGTIIGKTYGIYQRHENSTINIGRTTDELSTEIPLISGGLYGIYKTTGYTNFYNGRLRGYTDAFNGTFNNLRNEHSVERYFEEIVENKGVGTYSTTNTSATATSKYAKIGNGYARITYIGETTGICTKGTTYEFDYTGGEQTFTVPCTGTYTLETWGAQGGQALCNNALCGTPGYGGYSYGEIELTEAETLYINVGGQGGNGSLTTCSLGGYNGGGTGANDGGGCGTPNDDEAAGGGGGATHIATVSGILSTLEQQKDQIIIVSGGGGGVSWSREAGSGGGYQGAANTNTITKYATQTEGYAFGQGQNGSGQKQNTTSTTSTTGVAGGGGGYYGGYSNDYDTKESGTGGSGYIGNDRLSWPVMYGYNVPVKYPTWTNMILVSTPNFLQVGDELFSTFDDAMDSISEEGTILQIADGALGASTIPENKKITLDMNGYNLSMTKNITNNGDFTITNTSETKSKITSGVSGTLFTNNAILNVSNIDISGYNGFNNTANGKLTIDNINLNCTNQALINSGTMYIDNSDIYGKNYALYSNTTLENKVSNSKLRSGTNSIYKYSSSVTTITNTDLTGTINNSNANGILNITGGIIKGAMSNTGKSTLREIDMSYSYNNYNHDQMISNPGILTIEDSFITYTSTNSSNYSDYDSRIIHNTGTLNSYNNEYNVTNSSQYQNKHLVGLYNAGLMTSNSDIINVYSGRHGYGIYNTSSNTGTYSNIEINVHDNVNSYGIEDNKGVVTLNGGQINVYNSTNSYGLYMNSEATSKNVIYNIYNNTTSRGVYVNQGTMNFESGKTLSHDSQTSYGIQISTGTLNLGTEDGSGMDSADVSTTDPYIEGIGTTTGIGVSMGNGTFNFYDGLLTGSTGSRGANDITSMTEKNYQVITTINPDTGYEISILEFIK